MDKVIEEIIEVTETGGKQTKIYEKPTELPPFALKEISRVMRLGAEKYGSKNWHKLSIVEELDHSITHWINYQTGILDKESEREELAHFATRAVMALDQYLREEGLI